MLRKGVSGSQEERETLKPGDEMGRTRLRLFSLRLAQRREEWETTVRLGHNAGGRNGVMQ